MIKQEDDSKRIKAGLQMCSLSKREKVRSLKPGIKTSYGVCMVVLYRIICIKIYLDKPKHHCLMIDNMERNIIKRNSLTFHSQEFLPGLALKPRSAAVLELFLEYRGDVCFPTDRRSCVPPP